jgi:hypothetical protein
MPSGAPVEARELQVFNTNGRYASMTFGNLRERHVGRIRFEQSEESPFDKGHSSALRSSAKHGGREEPRSELLNDA